MEGPASSTTAEIYMQAYERTAQNIKFTMEEESNGELAFLGTIPIPTLQLSPPNKFQGKCCFLLV